MNPENFLHIYADAAVKLAFALFFGLLIGIDRQWKHKPLGIKTSMVISVASCLITIVSIESADQFLTAGRVLTMDPLRLAAQIVSGVGFIGAGVILRRQNDMISGLTTAAMVWAASGLGIAAGVGFFIEAGLAVGLIMLAVNLFPRLIKLLGPGQLSERDLSLTVVVERGAELDTLIERMGTESLRVKHMKLKDIGDDCRQLQLVVSSPLRTPITSVYDKLKQIRHVCAVEIEHISN